MRFKNRRISTSIEVVRDKCRPALLGGLDSHRLGLVKRVHTMQNDVRGDDETMRREVKKKYPQLFQGTGTLPECTQSFSKMAPLVSYMLHAVLQWLRENS